MREVSVIMPGGVIVEQNRALRGQLSTIMGGT